MAKIYVASSWRNELQQDVVTCLRESGHEVYDFKNPPERTGFSWSEIDPNWQNWNTKEFREALQDPIAVEAFKSDFTGMQWADFCVLLLPCGRSAHTEAGWMRGIGKYVYVYQPLPEEPELMYKIYDDIFHRMDDLLEAIKIRETHVTKYQ